MNSGRVRLSGGYDPEPGWLAGKSFRLASVITQIPGQNETPALIVELDNPLRVDDVTGSILVLELRYKGVTWGESNVVHLELCDFVPEAKTWRNRRQGKWIESHATCEFI